MAEATVYADSPNFEGGRMPSTRIDAEGKFIIRNLKRGVYRIYAEKQADGYPSPASAFISGDSPNTLQVNLYEQQITPDVTIALGPKAAKITGQIIDSLTGKPVKEVEIRLRRLDNPAYAYSTAADSRGKFTVLVPSVPFTIEVTAPGYEAWTYKKDGTGSRPDSLKVNPGGTKRFDIAMRHRN